MRVVSIGILILFVPAFVGLWGYISFSKMALQDVPPGVVLLLATILGAKAVQKFAE